MHKIRPAALLVGLAFAWSGCSSNPHPTPTVTPSTPAGAVQLAGLLPTARSAAYVARYRLVTSGRPGIALVYRYRNGLGIRIDITERGGTAIFIRSPSGPYACSILRRRSTCFRPKRRGAALPSILDPELENVFGAYLTGLATRPDEYRIGAAGTSPASPRVPGGTCFSITGTTPRPLVTAGTYCFATDGLVTKVVYPDGDYLQLIATGPPPTARVFRPPASPTPLP